MKEKKKILGDIDRLGARIHMQIDDMEREAEALSDRDDAMRLKIREEQGRLKRARFHLHDAYDEIVRNGND